MNKPFITLHEYEWGTLVLPVWLGLGDEQVFISSWLSCKINMGHWFWKKKEIKNSLRFNNLFWVFLTLNFIKHFLWWCPFRRRHWSEQFATAVNLLRCIKTLTWRILLNVTSKGYCIIKKKPATLVYWRRGFKYGLKEFQICMLIKSTIYWYTGSCVSFSLILW